MHRAARQGRSACAAVLARHGASRYTCCASGHQASVLAQAAALLPQERAATTRALDRVVVDDWLRSVERRAPGLAGLLRWCRGGWAGPATGARVRAASRDLRRFRDALEGGAGCESRDAKGAALCAAASAGRAAAVGSAARYPPP